MGRVIRLSLAWPLLLAGLILLPLPIPLGLPFIVIALALLVRDSVTIRNRMKAGRRRWRGIDAKLRTAEEVTWLPNFAQRMLRVTDPDGDAGLDQQEADADPHSGRAD